jgi:hypothetical protein
MCYVTTAQTALPTAIHVPGMPSEALMANVWLIVQEASRPSIWMTMAIASLTSERPRDLSNGESCQQTMPTTDVVSASTLMATYAKLVMQTASVAEDHSAISAQHAEKEFLGSSKQALVWPAQQIQLPTTGSNALSTATSAITTTSSMLASPLASAKAATAPAAL